jgi:hypothetical protein
MRRHTERVKSKRPRSGHASNYTNPTQNNAPTDGSNYERVGTRSSTVSVLEVRLHRRRRRSAGVVVKTPREKGVSERLRLVG